MYGVPVCECKANIKPRWVKDGPPVLVCARCGKCVPGYEQMWLHRESVLKSVDRS